MFERPAHQRVATLLGALDPQLLQRCQCAFGGGTRIALELGEYRESRDVDFLVSDADAYAALRMLVRDGGCSALLTPSARISLPREARVDQYAVRVPAVVDGATSARFANSDALRAHSFDGLAIADDLRAPMLACIVRWADGLE